MTTASVVPLEKATTASCGSKSAACSELARLAQESGTFSAPAGVCLPFGCMEAAIRVRLLRCDSALSASRQDCAAAGR